MKFIASAKINLLTRGALWIYRFIIHWHWKTSTLCLRKKLFRLYPLEAIYKFYLEHFRVLLRTENWNCFTTITKHEYWFFLSSAFRCCRWHTFCAKKKICFILIFTFLKSRRLFSVSVMPADVLWHSETNFTRNFSSHSTMENVHKQFNALMDPLLPSKLNLQSTHKTVCNVYSSETSMTMWFAYGTKVNYMRVDIFLKLLPASIT